MQKTKLLIVEDDEATRAAMKMALAEEFSPYTAIDGLSAVEALRSERMPVVLLDLGLPPRPEVNEDGLQTLTRLLEIDPIVKIVAVTGQDDKETSLKAVAMGAHDYFKKPVDLDEIRATIRRALYVYDLENENRKLKDDSCKQSFDDIIGESTAMQGIFATLRKIATTDVPVLLTGESGTGKELIAKAIHANGIRREKPFIPINCGAIPDNLLESELFGHEKGAFTGAHAQRCGRIELAHGGTLFLDEIGELPTSLQVKLLRFLQDLKVERVGGREQFDIDVRIIAATNRDIKKEIASGKFREDLYYRLAVVTIELPPLRERGDDTLILAKSILQKFASNKGDAKSLSTEAAEALKTYSWPGNIRELENRVRRALAFAESEVIRPEDLGFGGVDELTVLDFKKAKEDLEFRFVNLALTKHKGNISKAAMELGLSRPTVHGIIKRHGLKI